MSDVVKAGSEMMPSLKMAGTLTVRALDTLPLPLLVVVFLACLALLQWPIAANPSLLPTFTPPTFEKDRLSPLPMIENKPLFAFTPLTPLTAHLQIYAPTATASPTPSSNPMKQSGRNVRRGSKQLLLREWRLNLGVVEEDEGESTTIMNVNPIQVV
ncbi:hypothetical protein V866_007482 [Kwoniella sp. B9012]|uniref:Uncharacterized protein n=1 Tax=Kwoniella europaea PYCC6329 TaxID=1423913 RepID=A0AAX4KQ26_9TREE